MKSKSKKNNDLFNKFLTNKIVLYVVALISLIDIFAYIFNKEFGAIIFFYLSGLIAYKFTNNMTIVLGTALISTSLVHIIANMLGFKEGFVTPKLKEGNDDKKKKDKDVDVDDDEHDEHEDDNDAFRGGGAPSHHARGRPPAASSEDNEKTSEGMKSEIDPVVEPPTLFKETMKPKKQTFTNQKLKPKVINSIPNKDKLSQNMSKADNIEAAYDSLEKTIGENGIRSMSGATKDLISQQNNLVKGLKEVTPVLNEAMGALSKIDLSSLSGMFNKFSAQV